MQKIERRRAGEIGKGTGQAGQLAAFGLRRERALQETVFDGPGTAHTPVGGDHFLDQPELDIIERAEAVDVELEQFFEGVRRLVGKDHGFGKPPVTNGIPGGTDFSLRGFGSARAGPVCPRRSFSFFRDHRSLHSL
jgi:hypothetical protein